MKDDPIDDTRRMLHEVAPEAARVVLTQFVGEDDLSLPELILAALNKLPETGRIKRQKHNYVIKAISWLIDKIPNTEPRKGKIIHLFDGALNRSSLKKD